MVTAFWTSKSLYVVAKLGVADLLADGPQTSAKLAADDAEQLRDALLRAARFEEAVPAEEDGYGRRYVLDFEMGTETGSATVRSGWRSEEDFPRFTSCRVL